MPVRGPYRPKGTAKAAFKRLTIRFEPMVSTDVTTFGVAVWANVLAVVVVVDEYI